MKVKTLPIASFPGIRWDVDPIDLGLQGALDAQDVWFDTDGGLVVRPGESTSVTMGTNERVYGMYMFNTIGNSYLMVYVQNTVASTWRLSAYPINNFAAPISVTGSGTGTARAHRRFQEIKVGDISYCYVATPAFRRFDGSAWSSPGALPGAETPALFGRLPQSNRLVAVTGTYSNRLRFSNPSDPATWGANNYVDLGVVNEINELVEWENNLYVLTDNTIHVFGAPSTDPQGQPLFDYREVSNSIGGTTGIGARTGLFIASPAGVFKTRGGQPMRVSRPIDPFITNTMVTAGDTALTSAVSTHVWGLGRTSHMIWLAMATTNTGTVSQSFMYDEDRDVWARDSRVFGPVAGYDRLGARDRFSADPNTVPGVIRRVQQGQTSSISWKYTTGFYDAGSDDIKQIRRTAIVGSGATTVSMRADELAATTPVAVTLGAGAASDRGWDLRTVRGRRFSLRLAGTAAATISRVEQYVTRPRAPSVQET